MKKSFLPAISWILIFSVFAVSGCGGGVAGEKKSPAATLTSISVTPATPQIVQGGTLQFTATGTYSDNSTGDVTSNATWASTNTAHAAVTNAGLATGTGAGTSTISASYNGITSSTVLTVTASAVAPTITTQPASRSVSVGQTATFSVVATGTSPFTYQWRKNGTNIAGTNSASYTTPATALADNGANYSVVVGNSSNVNATSNDATLTVTASAAPSYVADYRVATDAALRAIPDAYINTARTTLHVAYFHTSHGTHVSYGAFGLPGFKAGDATKFGITNNTTADANKLDFHDNYGPDLSQADADWPGWRNQVRAYLDDPANAAINVMMWSWCDISGHSVPSYLSSMQTLINEYGPGGSKIGTGAGQTRTTPVTFIFMTGHANPGANTGAGNPRDQAALITAYCDAHSYLCIDYYSIDTHAMNGTYYEDTGDNGNSATGGNFYQAWQDSHAVGVDWYENRSSPGGGVTYGAHNTQHITANRKAFAFWWVLARIAGY